MIRNILTIPDSKLRQTSDEVITFDSNLKKLADDLVQTLESQKDPPGLGLSGVQIGVLKRIFAAKIRNKSKIFINPRITKLSKKETPFLEGCFSIPEIYGHVIRPAEIDLESQDVGGKKNRAKYKGITSRIIQHEIDHLNGTLFVDHIHDQGGKVFKVEKDKSGKEHLVEVALV